jgi:hypothetical protein
MNDATNAKIQLWRQKARDGTLTQEEMKEAITVLRADRIHIGAAKGRATKKAPINSEDLLTELEGL